MSRLDVEQTQPVIWITGLSGAGKTTLASALVDDLRGRGVFAVHVDGDAVREIVGDSLGHDQSQRIVNAKRVSRMCAFLQSQGMTVVCSTMSMYPEIWDWNRENLQPYCQVYLRVGLEVLQERDQKGLYSGVQRGETANVVGMNMQWNEPEDSDFVLSSSSMEDHAANRVTLLRHLMGD